MISQKHIDGLSFRKISDNFNISIGKSFKLVYTFFSTLPHCADITRKYCTRYCGILVVDGKYIKVKGYSKKIPVIYGIDYLTHDIPTYRIAPAENYLNICKFFESLRLLNYPLQVLVSDDNENIRKSCFKYYPKAVFQLCQRHYKESIKSNLDIDNNRKHFEFMLDIYDLFRPKRNEDDFNRFGKHLLKKYLDDELLILLILDIDKRKEDLLGYLKHKNTPRTTNLIECYNSHLQGRLKTIKGFDSLKNANLWLNAYFIRRRIKKFTDCKGRFKYLNGTCSLQNSIKSGEKIPKIFN